MAEADSSEGSKTSTAARIEPCMYSRRLRSIQAPFQHSTGNRLSSQPIAWFPLEKPFCMKHVYFGRRVRARDLSAIDG